MPQSHVAKVRKICIALKGVEETKNFGHQWFRIKGKPFCVCHGTADEPAIAFKVAKTEQGIFLEDSRFFKTPYMGHNGWVSIHAKGRLDWEEVAELIQGSFQLVAPRTLRG